MTSTRTGQRQQGMVLATALLFLIVITLLGLIAIRASTTDLQLALNEQNRTEAMATAQSMIDWLTTHPGHLVSSGAAYPLCYKFPGSTVAGSAPVSFKCNKADDKDLSSYAKIRRLDPRWSSPPEQTLTSAVHFGAARFSIRGRYQRTQAGLGAADIETGVVEILPRSRRIN